MHPRTSQLAFQLGFIMGLERFFYAHPDLSAIGLGSIGHVVCDRVVAEWLLAFLTVV